MLNTHSLKFRLIILGVVLVIVGVSLRLLFALPYAQGLLRDVMAAQQWSIASYVAHDIEHSIQTRRALLTELAGALPTALLQQPEQLTNWVQTQQRISQVFDRGLLMLQPDGAVLAQYPLPTDNAASAYANADWLQAALRAAGPVLSKPQRERDGEPVLIVATAIRAADQHVVAVLAGAVALNSHGLLHRLQETRLGNSGEFLLVSPTDKLFIGANNPALVLMPTPQPGINPLYDRAMDGYRGSGITTNADDIEELASIVSVPSTGWFVVARTPTTEVFYPITQMRSFILKSTLIILLALIAILLVLLPRMLRPLTDAARSMREMADGNRELIALPVGRRDEIGDLVLGFNYLLEQLREQKTALKSSEARLALLAHQDSLTGLHNRAMLEDRTQQALARAERNGTQFALLFCDLDGFKAINDNHGHDAGDALLRLVAARLSDGRRRTDTIARIGGDEFIILLTDLSDARSSAINVATQLLDSIAQPFNIEGNTVTIGASIGIGLYCGNSISMSQLISQDDIAMYQAKRSGKNSYRVFDETLAPLTTSPHNAVYS